MKKPDIVKKRLQKSIDNLGEAIRSRDWTRLNALDSEARQAIDEALKSDPVSAKAVKPLLEELQVLYQEMISTCQLERDRIKEQLTLSKRRQDAIESYQQSNRH